jgi:hypothetical protein
MEYKASTDVVVKLVTIGVTILFAFIIYRMMVVRSVAPGRVWPFISYGVTAFILITYFVGFGLCTWLYRTDTKHLIIVAPLYSRTIDILNKDRITNKFDWENRTYLSTKS